jgi:hypothetical protein
LTIDGISPRKLGFAPDSPLEEAGFEPSVPLRIESRWRAKSSGKVPDTHSVGAIRNHNLGVFTVTEIAVKNTAALPPAHRLPRTPKAAYSGLQRCRAPSVPLTCLARLAAWQSLCTGHIDALLKTPSPWPSPTGPASAEIADTSARPRERLACLATARPSRKHGPTRKRFPRLT